MPEEQTPPAAEIKGTEAEEVGPETIETSGEEETSSSSGGILNLLTPEGVIMMSVALILDGIGIILILFLLDDFFITDVIGTMIIGGWLFFRSGTAPSMPERKEAAGKVEKGAASTAAKAADAEKAVQKVGRSGRWLKPLLCGAGELITYLGALPFWTYAVYSELTSS